MRHEGSTDPPEDVAASAILEHAKVQAARLGHGAPRRGHNVKLRRKLPAVIHTRGSTNTRTISLASRRGGPSGRGDAPANVARLRRVGGGEDDDERVVARVFHKLHKRLAVEPDRAGALRAQ